MVAPVRFELTTFGLWARRASTALRRVVGGPRPDGLSPPSSYWQVLIRVLPPQAISIIARFEVCAIYAHAQLDFAIGRAELQLG